MSWSPPMTSPPPQTQVEVKVAPVCCHDLVESTLYELAQRDPVYGFGYRCDRCGRRFAPTSQATQAIGDSLSWGPVMRAAASASLAVARGGSLCLGNPGVERLSHCAVCCYDLCAVCSAYKTGSKSMELPATRMTCNGGHQLFGTSFSFLAGEYALGFRCDKCGRMGGLSGQEECLYHCGTCPSGYDVCCMCALSAATPMFQPPRPSPKVPPKFGTSPIIPLPPFISISTTGSIGPKYCCSKGHPLVPGVLQTYSLRYECDRCKRQSAVMRERINRCSACNYDICAMCAAFSKKLPGPKIPPLALSLKCTRGHGLRVATISSLMKSSMYTKGYVCDICKHQWLTRSGDPEETLLHCDVCSYDMCPLCARYSAGAPDEETEVPAVTTPPPFSSTIPFIFPTKPPLPITPTKITPVTPPKPDPKPDPKPVVTATSTTSTASTSPSQINECVVCTANSRDTLFMPCRHLICCSTCAEIVDACPFCRQPIATKIKVFT
ncbi:hypothetical protein Pelo_11636 [Pelomyxa schiedti]|nr:hypothetical protein Pelo_11636 [Pelomyxa schiedti]